MPEMLGNRVLPESFASQRRKVREKLSDVRRPVREFREENVPGPDVVGKFENTFTDVRDKFVRRDSVVDRIRNRRDSDSGGSNSSKNNKDSGSMV